jgi:hypothetical protein
MSTLEHSLVGEAKGDFEGGIKTIGTPLPRYRRAPLQAPGLVLTVRDEALLEDVWRYGFLTTTQIELLRGASTEPALRFVSRLTLTRRLKLLFHHRYLQRLPRPLAQGSQEPVYVLDREGARVLSLQHGEVGARPASRLPKTVALGHGLSIVQVRVALAVAGASAVREISAVGEICAMGESSGLYPDATEKIEILEWLPGAKTRFRVTLEASGERRQSVSLIPDAGLVVRAGNEGSPKRRHYAFLEVDKGTEPGRILTEKVRAYIAYWQSGGFARDFRVPPGLGFWVLFVAPTPKRAATILKSIAAVAGPRLMFRVALEEKMTPEHITEAVWREGEHHRWCQFWQVPS